MIVVLLTSSSVGTKEQTFWALGNIVTYDEKYRDTALTMGILDALNAIFSVDEAEASKNFPALQKATWLLSNILVGRSGHLSFEHFETAIYLASNMLMAEKYKFDKSNLHYMLVHQYIHQNYQSRIPHSLFILILPFYQALNKDTVEDICWALSHLTQLDGNQSTKRLRVIQESTLPKAIVDIAVYESEYEILYPTVRSIGNLIPKSNDSVNISLYYKGID